MTPEDHSPETHPRRTSCRSSPRSLAGLLARLDVRSRRHRHVVIGYQSKTINTVTAGTLLNARDTWSSASRISDTSGKTYKVEWQDYDTGAPITAQMVAEKIDIGSMGDYPLLINGSKTQANERARTEFVSVTGYNPKGALNMVVVPPDSPVRSIADLDGQEGLRQRRLRGPRHPGPRARQRRHRPEDRRRGAQPAAAGRRLGAGIRSGRRRFRSSSPGPACSCSRTRRSCSTTAPRATTRPSTASSSAATTRAEHPEVLDAFLQAQLDATEFLNENPLEAARARGRRQRSAAGGRLPLQRSRRHRASTPRSSRPDRGVQGRRART